MSTPSPKGTPGSVAVTAVTARIVMFIVFVGSGLSMVLALVGSPYAGQLCLGSGLLAGVALLVGAYFVARAKA